MVHVRTASPIEPPRRGGSNEYPQSMFWSKSKKNRYTPAYPSFAKKWDIRGYILHGHVFLMKYISNFVFYDTGKMLICNASGTVKVAVGLFDGSYFNPFVMNRLPDHYHLCQSTFI